MDINKFKGVFPRDWLPNPLGSGYYVINLDDSVGEGTHWVVLYVRGGNKSAWYFESFGLRPPQEIVDMGIPFVYSSSQYQPLKSVLCGYYCIYFIRECSDGRDLYDITKVFDTRDKRGNDNIIRSYFYG